jgi:D-proline reductase (dithiol) PrdB
MLVRSWIDLEKPRDIPWTPLEKPLEQSTIALVSSAGLALKTDQPFDQEGERQNPWWGDPSIRVIPNTAVTRDIKLYHLHLHPCVAERDMNSVLPLQRLLELQELGEIGHSADSHYSYMGYILEPQNLLEQYVPLMIHRMKLDGVNAVVLIPG